MELKYRLAKNVFLRIDMGRAYLYDGNKKQIYKLPLFWGILLDSVRMSSKSINEIVYSILSSVTNLDDNVAVDYEKKIRNYLDYAINSKYIEEEV